MQGYMKFTMTDNSKTIVKSDVHKYSNTKFTKIGIRHICAPPI